MTLQQRLLLTQYLSNLQGTEFRWGSNDCNTMVSGLVDRLYHRDTSRFIRLQYHDFRSAVRFSRDYMTARQWLGIQGYREQTISSVSELEDGDILLIERSGYSHASIFYRQAAYTLSEDTGFVATLAQDITETYTVWRHQ